MSVDTDLSVTGKVAQFGRGVMADVSSKLMAQFVENLETIVLADDGSVAARTLLLPSSTNARAQLKLLRPGFVKILCRPETGVVIGGVVVIGFGTSAPEMLVSGRAAASGSARARPRGGCEPRTSRTATSTSTPTTGAEACP